MRKIYITPGRNTNGSIQILLTGLGFTAILLRTIFFIFSTLMVSQMVGCQDKTVLQCLAFQGECQRIIALSTEYFFKKEASEKTDVSFLLSFLEFD